MYSINCLSLDENRKKLAVLRRCLSSDERNRGNARSLIEIWNIENMHCNFVEQTIIESEDEPNLIESLAWGVNGRLFSCGLNAFLNEYNLNQGMIKKSYAVTSGPAWCLSFDSSLTFAAIGTEEGFVCIFKLGDGLLEDEVNFDRTLMKNDTRIMCLEWFERNKSKVIITGSVGTIKIWNYDSRQCTDVIRIGSESTVVWCLTVLRDNFVIVSGDSNGKTSFWDGNTATLIQEHKAHKADVLCLCKGTNGSVLSSGVDPLIVEFKPASNMPFVQGNRLLEHTHDVRALVHHSSGWLFSGGIDVYLVKSFYPPKKVIRYAPNFSELVNIVNDLVMFQYNNRIEVWKLGMGDNYLQYTTEGTFIPVLEEQQKLIEITSSRTIQKSALSHNFIAFSTFHKLKVFSFSNNKIEKIALVCEPVSGVIDKIQFSGEKYLVISTGMLLYVFQLDINGIVLHYSFPIKTRITTMCTSPKFVAFKTLDRSIAVYDVESGQSVCHCDIDFHPVFMKFNCSTDELWLSSADQWLVKYNLKSNKSEQNYKVKELDIFTPIIDILFTESSLFVHSENVVLCMKQGMRENKSCTRYRHVAKLSNLSERKNELAVVEVTPEAIFKHLPEALAIKKFGT
ncbi:hypothetical protein B4U80_08330 [Leptotrombidium deliense]|uniref:Uncharacterized protein n=1 Tax=Leptotrombidium deliense TaxID=299467 RepID=A0A443ST22_9ACAR|nr:hypothetical protein B4U80_08330 [Leptotrombidium deliense]